MAQNFVVKYQWLPFLTFVLIFSPQVSGSICVTCSVLLMFLQTDFFQYKLEQISQVHTEKRCSQLA